MTLTDIQRRLMAAGIEDAAWDGNKEAYQGVKRPLPLWQLQIFQIRVLFHMFSPSFKKGSEPKELRPFRLLDIQIKANA